MPLLPVDLRLDNARQHVPLHRHPADLQLGSHQNVLRIQVVRRRGNRQHVPRLRTDPRPDNHRRVPQHQADPRQGNRQHVRRLQVVRRLDNFLRPARVPQLRVRARVRASTATRSRMELAPVPDRSPPCPTGSNPVRRNCPARAPHHQPPVNSQRDPEEKVLEGPEPAALVDREVPELSHQQPGHQEAGRQWPRNQSPLGPRSPDRRSPASLADRLERVPPEYVPLHIVHPLAILLAPGIRGIQAIRAIVLDTGGAGPLPRPLRVGSYTVGRIRSTIVTEPAGRFTTRTMSSMSTVSSTVQRKSTTPTRRRLPRRFPR